MRSRRLIGAPVKGSPKAPLLPIASALLSLVPFATVSLPLPLLLVVAPLLVPVVLPLVPVPPPAVVPVPVLPPAVAPPAPAVVSPLVVPPVPAVVSPLVVPPVPAVVSPLVVPPVLPAVVPPLVVPPVLPAVVPPLPPVLPGVEHSVLVMVFVSRVTAPFRASRRPATVALVLAVMEASASTVPAKLVVVPSVAELPTCQKTLQGSAPLTRRTALPDPVLRVLPALKT
jgi:hypothetical protein